MRGRSFRFLSIIASFLVIFSFYSPLHAEIDPQHQAKLEQLASKMEALGFSRAEIDAIFSDSRLELYPEIVERRGKGINYMSHRFGMFTKKSIERGRRILNENRDVLEKIERSYGVEKEVIVAILRIETNFGKNTGSYPIINSLLTMTLIENRRTAWAENELMEFLRICREQNKDPFSVRGSWAGAFGICQFIPSSYVRFAIDGDGDGSIDLFDFDDAAESIANYLNVHGWKNNRLKAKRKAVHAYNHCDSYVKAVLAYAKATKKRP